MTRAFLIFGVGLLSYGQTWAYVGIAVFVMLTGAGLPVPEEVFIIAAGAASAQGQLDPWVALGACLCGALAGDCILYWIGYHFGRRVVREHHWWTRFVHPEREARMERMIHGHGLKVLFLARFLVGIRAPVYLSAGVLRVPFRRFFLYDLLCATIVIGTFFGLSYFLSDQYGDVIYDWIHKGEAGLTVTVVVALAVVGIYYWVRHRRKSAKIDSVPPAAGDAGPPAAGGDGPPEPESRQPGQSDEQAGANKPIDEKRDFDRTNVEPASRRP